MSRYNFNSGYGQALLNSIVQQVPTFGRIFIVMDPDDTDEQNYKMMQEIFGGDPDGKVRFYTSLESAYGAVESNNNDVIALDGNSTHLVDDLLTAAKNRVHFIGFDGSLGKRPILQGAKIALSDATVDAAATLSVTGVRNTFRNLKITNSGTHANSVAAAIGDGDEGTLWEGCSIQKLSDLGEAAVSDFLCRSDSPTFRNVEFGFDTLTQTAARATFRFTNSGGTRAKNVRAYDCIFTCASTAATKSHILVTNTSSLNNTNVFKDCIFLNSLVGSAAALNDAVTSVSSLVEGSLLFINPASEATEFCSAVTDQVKVVGPAVSAQAGEAVTPT